MCIRDSVEHGNGPVSGRRGAGVQRRTDGGCGQCRTLLSSNVDDAKTKTRSDEDDDEKLMLKRLNNFTVNTSLSSSSSTTEILRSVKRRSLQPRNSDTQIITGIN